MVIMENRCYFGVAQHDPSDADFYDEEFMNLLIYQSAKHFFFMLEVCRLSLNIKGTFEDSDVIGAGVSIKEKMVVFTQNGVAIAAFQHEAVEIQLFSPCVRNVGRIASLNVGQRGKFAFEKAESFLQNIEEYLDRP
jgi:hypothetical protein